MGWIDYIKTESDKALKEIYADEKDRCVSWLSSNTNLSREQGLDVFQTAVIILYDNVMSGKLTRLDSKLSTYLIGICKNKSRELIRAESKYSATDEFPLLKDHCDEEIEEKKEKELMISTISKMLNRMGDPCKSLLHLFYYVKMSMEEIAELMGYNNTATAKNQKYKCMKRLQKLCVDING